MDRQKRSGLIALSILSAYMYSIAGVFIWLGHWYRLEYITRLGVAVAVAQTVLVLAFTVFPKVVGFFQPES